MAQNMVDSKSLADSVLKHLEDSNISLLTLIVVLQVLGVCLTKFLNLWAFLSFPYFYDRHIKKFKFNPRGMMMLLWSFKSWNIFLMITDHYFLFQTHPKLRQNNFKSEETLKNFLCVSCHIWMPLFFFLFLFHWVVLIFT